MMNKEEDAVKTRSLIEQMTSQDDVDLVIGTWTRGDTCNWIFEPDPMDVTGTLRLQSGLSYSDLVANVKGSLNIVDPNINVKLAYQYPQWLAIDDADGSTPQYITDDQEVDVFIQMRRHIEEVNLCVTVSKSISGITTGAAGGNKNSGKVSDVTYAEDEELINCGEEGNAEWHEFAMSESPMTFPSNDKRPINKTAIPIRVGRRRRSNGISFREPEPVIRLASPAVARTDKGKGIAYEDDSESDSDDDAVVPVVQPDREAPVGEGAPTNGVRRRLFMESHTCEEGCSESDEEGEEYDDDIPLGEKQTWGRFEEALHKILSDFSSDPTLFGRDAPPVYETKLDDVDTALADVAYEGDKLYIGRVYKSKTDCKIKIAIHAINRRFHFRTTRSTPQFMVMQCACLTCGWRVYTVLLDGSGKFQIRSANLVHSCNVDERRNYHRLATTQVIGEIMQTKFVGIKKGPTPAGIRKVMLDDYHVNISYWKAWRSRELAMDTALGTIAGSYALLPAYLALLQNANTGTQCYLEHEENPDGGARFKYCFVAYGASIAGYPFMRKVIVIDGTSLKGRYGGCLLSACTQDANFQIFPLAFAVVDSENDDAWTWFLTKLSTFVDDSTDLVFVSDRHASIYKSIATVYPQSYHVACTVHLWRNVRATYRPRRLAKLMFDAAKEFTVEGFNKKFIEIQKLNPGCAAYLVDMGFEHWTRAHFKGRRFNIMDSNIAESWNAVLKEAREYPLICMFEYIRTSVMTWFAIRRAKAMKNNRLLSPYVRKLVSKTFEESIDLSVRMISEYEFQVQEQEGRCHTVKLLDGTCSCLEFQQLGIPCKHAIAAAGAAEMPTESLVSAAYYAETWNLGFTGNIYPVPSVGNGEIGSAFRGELMPPFTKRPPGRPKKRRILSRREFKNAKKSGRRCTRCRLEGHNKASCKNPI